MNGFMFIHSTCLIIDKYKNVAHSVSMIQDYVDGLSNADKPQKHINKRLQR